MRINEATKDRYVMKATNFSAELINNMECTLFLLRREFFYSFRGRNAYPDIYDAYHVSDTQSGLLLSSFASN